MVYHHKFPIDLCEFGGSMALWANPWWCFFKANDGRWWMIPSSFCFWWVNGAVASVYTIHEPFEHCLLQLGFWNILLVCPLFPFNSTLILQNLLKRLWLNPFLICASVLKSSGFTCHQTWLGTPLSMAGSGWFPSLRNAWIMGDCQAARPIQRKVTSYGYPFFESDIHELCEDFPSCHGTNHGCSESVNTNIYIYMYNE